MNIVLTFGKISGSPAPGNHIQCLQCRCAIRSLGDLGRTLPSFKTLQMPLRLKHLCQTGFKWLALWLAQAAQGCVDYRHNFSLLNLMLQRLYTVPAAKANQPLWFGLGHVDAEAVIPTRQFNRSLTSHNADGDIQSTRSEKHLISCHCSSYLILCYHT